MKNFKILKTYFVILLCLFPTGVFSQKYENVSANISHVSRLRLKVLADYLRENPNYSIIIEGHVCCGPAERLSTKRARAVYKHLLKLNVERTQMSYVGKSFDEPIVKVEKSEQDKERNRRVEIELILPKK